MKTALLSLLVVLSCRSALAQSNACHARLRADVDRVAPGALADAEVDRMCADIAVSERRAARPHLVADDGVIETDLVCGHGATGVGFGGALMFCYDWRAGDVYGVTVAQFGSSVEVVLGGGFAKFKHRPEHPITGEYACATGSYAVGLGVRLMACTQYGSNFMQTLYYGGVDLGGGATLGPAPIVFVRKF